MKNIKEINIEKEYEKGLEKFFPTLLGEQETIINVDYYAKEVSVYTCRKSVAKRLYNKLGIPDKTYSTNNKISGVRYFINFDDKRSLNKVLSRPTLIGNIKM